MTKRVALTAAVLASLFIYTGSAQAEVKITIPFDFSVGKVLLPSGTYTISKMGAAQTLLQIRNNDVAVGVIEHPHVVELGHGQVSEADKLVFHRYGDRYFLAQFWFAGSTRGCEFRRSKVEVEIENASKPRTEVLTASR